MKTRLPSACPKSRVGEIIAGIPSIAPRGPVPDDIDRHLSRVARSCGKTTPDVRNALYSVYQCRLAGTVSFVWHRHFRTSHVERADLEQECFLIFVDVLEQWPGQGSFSHYLFGRFKWRLLAAGRRLQETPQDDTAARHRKKGRKTAISAGWVIGELEEIGIPLSPVEKRIVRLKVERSLSTGEIGRTLGICRRTVQRRLASIRRAIEAANRNA